VIAREGEGPFARLLAAVGRVELVGDPLRRREGNAMHASNSRERGRVSRGARVLIVGLVATALLGLPLSVVAAPSIASCVVRTQGTHVTYGTVQAALDASPAGATILVRGTCVGTTIVSKDAAIRAAPIRTSYRATLDGDLGGSVISISAGVTVTLERLIITRGFFSFLDPHPGGGGILNRGTLILKRSIVSESTGQQGGGIANLGDATILNSTIDHNGVYQGGNIYNAGTLLVKDSRLTRGGGRFGQGLWNSFGASATLIRTSVTDSDPALPFSGGGIENYGDLTLDHSTVARNVSLWGAGILNQGTAHLDSSTVVNNFSAFGGGGILNGPTFGPGSGGEQVFLTDSKVANNTANFGGGIYNKGVVTLGGNSRIGANTAGGDGQGGGIFNDPGASVVGVTGQTFRPPNIPDQCVGCAP
jgi:hypothetical protein